MERIIQPWRDLLQLPRELRLLAALTFVNRLGALGVPFLVLYLVRERGFGEATAGLVLSAYGVGALAAGGLSLLLVRWFGTGRAIAASLLCAGVCQLAFPFVRSPASVIALAVLWALAAEVVRPASFTYVANAATEQQQMPAFVGLRLAVNLGLSVGPLLAGALATRAYAAVFIVDGLTSIVAGVVALALPRSSREFGAQPASESQPVPERGLVIVLVSAFLIAVVFYQYISTVPLYLVEHLGLSEAVYGAIFSLNSALILIFELPLVAAFRKYGQRAALALGAALIGIGFGATGLIQGFASACAVAVIWSVGEMFYFPVAPAYLSRAAGNRARYQALYSTAWSLALVVGPALGTASFHHLGPSMHWAFISATGVATGLLLWRGVPKEKTSDGHSEALTAQRESSEPPHA